jgi:hypothetical protein
MPPTWGFRVGAGEGNRTLMTSLQGHDYVRPLCHAMGMTLTTRMLTPETWDDFAALVEANNGVWGGCWCIGFHPEGVGHGREGNRELKRQHVTRGTVHQVLVYDGDRCVGWCQFGSPPEIPNINNRGAYDRCGRGSARGDQAGRRRHRRGLSGADRAAAAAAWRLSAHRTGGVVCAIRLHAGTEDREVAVGHAHQDLIPAARRRSRKAMFP